MMSMEPTDREITDPFDLEDGIGSEEDRQRAIAQWRAFRRSKHVPADWTRFEIFPSDCFLSLPDDQPQNDQGAS